MAKHLLFDFGAVLIPIDPALSHQAFEQLGAKAELEDQNELFHQMEKGEHRSSAFLEKLRPFFFRTNIFKPDLAKAWNAMIPEGIPVEHIRLLQQLKKDYSLYLLSNTNSLHIQRIKELCGPFNYKQFTDQFQQVYYSHEMGLRKPDPAFFQNILEKENINPEDCFFIDDREDNIEAAKALGMECWHFNPEEDSLNEIKKRLRAASTPEK